MAKVSSCCFHHYPLTLGISPIPPHTKGPSVLDLLGDNDKTPPGTQELKARLVKKHPYIFNLGGGKWITDYHAAEDELLQRNFPHIADNVQTSAVFVPELFISKVPRMVDIAEYEARKKNLDDKGREYLGIRNGSEEMQNVLGEQVERALAAVLKDHYADTHEKEVVVLQGPIFKTPGEKMKKDEEHDLIIICKNSKCIICIESKKSLHAASIKKGLHQLESMKTLVERYFGPLLLSGEWSYVPLIHFQENRKKWSICPECRQFCILNLTELPEILARIENHLRPSCKPSHEEYTRIVKSMIFTILAKDIGTPCTVAAELYDKIEGTKYGKKYKQGQGDLKSILFWSPDQANIILSSDPRFQFVAFISSWSTGKTLLMKAMARKRAEENKDQHVCYCIIRYMSQKKTMLELATTAEFEDLENVDVIAPEVMGHTDVVNIASKLRTLIDATPGTCWFVDEMILPTPGGLITQELMSIVTNMKTQTMKPCLWIATAGFCEGKNEDFDKQNYQAIFPNFHIPGLDMPLRSTKAMLKLANLENGRSSEPLLISATHVSSVNFSIPPQLLDGVSCQEFRIFNPKDENEVENVVRLAREFLASRLGSFGGITRGVPVLCTPDLLGRKYQWISNGLRKAEGWAPDLHPSLSPVRPQPLIYVEDKTVLNQAQDTDVSAWLAGLANGTEERDLITDEYCSRGWETIATMVVDLHGYGHQHTFQNLVMRSVAHSVLIRKA